MKIAITAKGTDLGSEVDQRFGRCQYFMIVDTETMDFQAVSNESGMATGGAGPQASQAISKLGAEAVITGNVGPNAFLTLQAAGIEIITGSSGTVKEMVDKFNSGTFSKTEAPTTDSHSGMGQGGR